MLHMPLPQPKELFQQLRDGEAILKGCSGDCSMECLVRATNAEKVRSSRSIPSDAGLFHRHTYNLTTVAAVKTHASARGCGGCEIRIARARGPKLSLQSREANLTTL